MSQAVGTANAKSLNWERAWDVLGREGRPGWRESGALRWGCTWKKVGWQGGGVGQGHTVGVLEAVGTLALMRPNGESGEALLEERGHLVSCTLSGSLVLPQPSTLGRAPSCIPSGQA